MRKLTLLIALLFYTAPFAQDLPNIAVYITGGQHEDENRALGTLILDALINSGRYVAVERSKEFVEQLYKEQTTQRSGAVDDNEIRRLGVQAGVQFVCIADINRAFGASQISARIIDIETAKVISIGVANVNMEMMSDMECVSNEIVMKMVDPNAAKTAAKRGQRDGCVSVIESSRPKKIDKRNYIGTRIAFGDGAVNAGVRLTLTHKNNTSYTDLIAGYYGFKYEPSPLNWGFLIDDYEGVTVRYRGFEAMAAQGKVVNITSDGVITGQISFVSAAYWGDPFMISAGVQIGAEYNFTDFAIGLDFRQLYYIGFCDSIFDNGLTGFRFTIGLNVRHRI
ncbi:MAG: hypothetical protein LBB56_08985 [Chitinispirillales bacterium]|jgi:hypothetical protein|nr:hypothetical protein [Chitinispirillales bacterium]